MLNEFENKIDNEEIVTPALSEKQDNLAEPHETKTRTRNSEAVRSRITARFEPKPVDPEVTKQISSTYTGATAAIMGQIADMNANGGYLKSSMKAAVEVPRVIYNGLANTINSIMDSTEYIGETMADFVMQTSDEEKAQLEELEINPRIPMAGEPSTVVGKVGQEMITFLGLFQFAGGGATAPTSIPARMGADAVKGAMADFMGPAYETRASTALNDVLKENFPGQENTFLEWMAGDPDDTEGDKRIKNMIEGAPLGVAADVFLTGLRALKKTRWANKAADKIFGPGHSSGTLDPEIKFDDLDTSTPAAPIEVEHPIVRGAEELVDADSSIVRAAPYVERNGKRVRPIYTANREQITDVISKTEADYTNPDKLVFRAIFPDDLKFKEGKLQANPKGHATEEGENLVASWWSSSLEDAKEILKNKGEGARVVAMKVSDLPDKTYLQNVTPVDDVHKVWVGVPADVPHNNLLWVDTAGDSATIVAKPATKGGKNAKTGIDDVGTVGEVSGRQGVSETPGGQAGRSDEQLAQAADEQTGGAGHGQLKLESVSGKTPVEINFARIEAPEDIKTLIQDMANAKAGDIDDARRGVRTWEETKLSAEQEDAWKILSERRSGDPLNAEQSLAVRELWVRSAGKLKTLADQAAINPSEANLFKFRKMAATHSVIQQEVIAARTETARALNAWKIPAGGNAEKMRQMNDVLNAAGGPDVTREMAERYSKMVNGGEFGASEKFLERSIYEKTKDGIAQVWVNSLLSGPKTLARNAISQTAVLGQMIYERKAAELISGAHANGEIARGEAMQLIYGLVDGFKDSFRVTAKGRKMAIESAKKVGKGDVAGAKAALEGGRDEFGTVFQSVATGESGIGLGKIDLPRQGSLSAESLGVQHAGVGKALDVLDTVSQLPGRALTISDEYFKTSAYRMELRAQSLRLASKEIADGKIPAEQLKDRMAELINDPTEELRLASADAALTATFTGPVGPVGEAITKLAQKTGPLGRIILPFRRTPINIAAYTFERTPLAPLVKNWRADMAAGGAKRDLALARTSTGTAIMLVMADLAMNGTITGDGPADNSQKATLQRQGWQPNSVRVPTEDGGTRYFSYRGLEPISTLMGLSANTMEIMEQLGEDDENAQADELVIAGILAIGNNVTSQTYMTGVSNFIEALNDPARFGESYFKRLAASTIPSAVGEVATYNDPYMRAASDMADAMKRKTPGLSKDLPFVRDLWGRPMDRRSGIGPAYDAFSPIYSRKFNPQAIDTELESQEIYVSRPSKKSVFNGVVMDLDRYPHAYDRYQELSGNAMTQNIYGAPIDVSGKGLKDALNDLVTGKHPLSQIYDLYSDGPDGGKSDLIKDMVRQYREAARAHILKEFPEIEAEVEIRKAQHPGKINLAN